MNDILVEIIYDSDVTIYDAGDVTFDGVDYIPNYGGGGKSLIDIGTNKKRYYQFIKVYDIDGQKIFKRQRQYATSGIKSIKINETTPLIGRKVYNYYEDVFYRGTLKTTLETSCYLLGKKQFIQDELYNLSAQKRFSINEAFNLEACKQFYNEQTFSLNSALKSPVENKYLMNGMKKIEVNENFGLTAKRDIRQIILSLLNLQ